MESPKDAHAHRIDRHRGKADTGQQLALGLSIGAGLIILLLVLILATSTGRSPKPAPATRYVATRPVRQPPKPPPDLEAEAAKYTDEELLPKKEEPDKRRPTGPLYGDALRQAINDAFLAAKRRADRYAAENQWGKAISAMEQVSGRYDDEELRLRCEPEIEKLRERARTAFSREKDAAEQLANAGRYDEARAALRKIVEAYGREEFVEPAQERIKELTEREESEAAARYQRLMSPVEGKVPEWKFREALDEASKLRFVKAHYKERHAARLARFRELVALKEKMIERVNMARPRLSKASLRVPGISGELTGADAEKVTAETKEGEEVFSWPKLGPEASMRLGLLAGKASDAQHVVAVARLLMEVGYAPRAAAQLERAKEMGANTAADEAELKRRQQ